MIPLFWIYLFMKRFAFSGAVCSGVYLTDEDYDKDSDVENKYLVLNGLFIKIVFFFWLLVIGCIMTAICGGALAHLKNTEDRRTNL